MGNNRLIPESYWSNILSDSKPTQGRNFESLVEDLLKIKYKSLSWKATKITHDGKKDFWCSKPIIEDDDLADTQIWAECKCYKENLSIDAISGTILFAILQEPNILLIFSYSPLNGNAQKSISLIDRKNLHVICYDGNVLDKEIAKYDELLLKYFGLKKDDLYHPLRIKPYTVFSSISRDVLNYNFNSATEGKRNDVYLNERFAIDITIKNEFESDADFDITIENFNDICKYFNILDKEFLSNQLKSIYLHKGDIVNIRFYFQLVSVVPKNKASIKFNVTNKTLGISEIKLISINCVWVLKTSLIGASNSLLNEEIRPRLTNRNKLIYFHLYGKSGTGKSRLLEEITNELVTLNSTIISFEGESSESIGIKPFFRKIISVIEGLPIVSDKNKHNKLVGIEKSKFVHKVLYDDFFVIKRLDCIDYLFSKSNDTEISIIVDNMQFVSEDVIAFINECQSQITTNCKLMFFLCFNTDFIKPETDNSVKKLHASLKEKSAKNKDEYQSFEVQGLNYNQGLEFLYSFLPQLKNFPNTAKKILNPSSEDKVSFNISPLFLEQIILHLKSKGVLLLESSELYFKDIDRFNIEVQKLPENIHILLNSRWEFLKTNERFREYNRILIALKYFRTLPDFWLSDLNIEKKDINFLIETGFVKKNNGKENLFYHKQLELFFDEILEEQNSILNDCLLFIENRKLIEDYAVPYFLLKYDFEKTSITEETIKHLLPIYKNRLVNLNVVINISEKLFNVLIFTSMNISPSDEIVLFIGICEYIKTYKSFSDALKLYKEAYLKTNRNLNRYHKYGEDYYAFIHRISNSYLALHRDYNAQETILNSLDKIELFYFNTLRIKQIAVAKLYNRLCVTYKSLNILQESEKYIKMSIEIAKDNNEIALELKNYIDYGYLFYKRIDSMDNLRKTWGKAIEKFFKYKNKGLYSHVVSREVSTYFHASLLALLENDYEKSEEMVENGLFYAQRKFDTFNEIKLLLVKSLICILKNRGNENLERADEIAYEALDKCIAYNSQRSYWVTYHLLGKISSYKFDVDKLQYFYKKALEQLEFFVINETMENKYEYFFDDLAVNFRKQHIKDHSVIKLIKSNEIKRRITKIMSMTDEEFSSFYKEFKPITSITEGKTNFPLP
ncbi:hypothetical protein [Tenacibaculum sp.]|uniref:hypothetical protein n=1 Tax=Tenacibaculum sp. TaxID=1906242 RepID=UPI003D0F8E82